MQKRKQCPDACPEIEADSSSGFGKGLLGLSGLTSPIFVKKQWGYEKIYQNNLMKKN